MTHYAPANGIYVYFRHTDNNIDRVMVVINKNAEATELELDRFAESFYGVNLGFDVVTGDVVGLGPSITVPPCGSLILELQ